MYIIIKAVTARIMIIKISVKVVSINRKLQKYFIHRLPKSYGVFFIMIIVLLIID